MRILLVIMICALSAGCKRDRFNFHDLLAVKPTQAELVGSYRLQKADPAATPLMEMGYTEIDCVVELNADGTYTASRLPGCCIHGWDESSYPFTGGLYSMKGNWTIVPTGSVYDIELTINSFTEHTGLVIADSELAAERQPRSTLKVSLIRGAPIDLGFEVFNGDFWPVRLARQP